MENKETARFCLLNVASKLFSQFGYDKTSTREIAKKAKVNISMIAYYFGGKEGLFKQVLINFAKNIEAKAEDIFQDYKSEPLSRENFLKIFDNIIDHIIKTRIENPEICLMIARDKIEGLKQSREVHEKVFTPLVERFIEYIHEAQSKKIISNDVDPLLFFTLLTEGIWGFFEVSSCNLLKTEGFNKLIENPIQLRNQIIKIYIEGILL